MVASCHMPGLEVITVVYKQECCVFSGEPALQLRSQRTVLTYTSMLAHVSNSSGSLAAVKYQQAKQESAAVLLCSCKVPGKGWSSANISSPKPQAADFKVRWRRTWWMWVHLAACQSVLAHFSRHWCFCMRLLRMAPQNIRPPSSKAESELTCLSMLHMVPAGAGPILQRVKATYNIRHHEECAPLLELQALK